MSFTRSRIYADDRVEAIKTRLNASNIIKEEILNQSIHSRRDPIYKSSVAPSDLNLPHKNNFRVGDMRGRVEKELNQGVGLATDKKQLQLLVEDQIEIQARLRADYMRQIDGSRGQFDQHQRTLTELRRELDEKSDKLSKKQDFVSQMESELNSLAEENRTLEGEIKRLAEKTTNKINEMQSKMQNLLGEQQALKDKHEQELERLNQFSADKIRRTEEDLSKKAQALQDKLNDVTADKQDAEAELLRLQDYKKRAEAELEEKIKIMKQEFYDEDYVQFSGIYRINQNKLRTVQENKEITQKKQVALQKDLEMLARDLEKSEKELAQGNGAIEAEIKSVRDEIVKIQKDIEDMKNQNMQGESGAQRIQGEISKLKFNFKQISDSSKFKIKDLVEKYRGEINTSQSKILAQQQRNKELNDELNDLNNKFKMIEKQAQRMVENMKNQLNRNIVQTINDYKDINQTQSKNDLGNRSFSRFA